MDLEDLEVYKLAREVSRDAWAIYDNLNWRDKKIMGDQFIEAIDSIGANIAEGFGRFHWPGLFIREYALAGCFKGKR